ncbi:MAG: S8 family serine peptidase [Bacteroidetes bacterium]|nr:S8 family serine peptidase [Bacteroidota bacterium]
MLQHRTAIAGSTSTIIVKFKTVSALQSPSAAVRAVIARFSAIGIESAPRIVPSVTSTNLLSIHSWNGLDRIIVLPLRSGISRAQAVDAIARLADVEYAEENHVYHIDRFVPPNDSLYSQQWAHDAMDVPGAWSYTQGDSTVNIGFVDTGVQWDHPDLVGQFAVNTAEDINHNGLFDPWPSTETHPDAYGHLVTGDLDGIDEDGNGYVDDVIGYDFVDQSSINFGDASGRDPIPYDEESHTHGTAVAGVIGAKANNRIGVAGVAPGCRLVALRALDALGNGESDDIASAIVYAADNGVKVLNLSFGDYFPSMLMHDAISYATEHGVLVVASSGNEGSDARHYPSDFSECLSVGMTTQDNSGREVLSPNSSYGEGMDLIAPGTAILTTAADGSYQSISGTSFSAPATAAVAGLLLSHNPRLGVAAIRSILESTTDKLSKSTYDHSHANGRVNAKRALAFVGSANIKIASPRTDDELQTDSSYSILGSAVSSLFTGYSVSYASGLNPDHDINNPPSWTLIDSSAEQVLDGTLATWKPAGLTAGTYTIRLAVSTTDRRSVEERITVRLRTHQAFAADVQVDTMYQNERRILLIHGRADSLSHALIRYRAVGSSEWSVVNDDQYAHGHSMLLSTNEVRAGVPIELSLVLFDNANDTVTSSFIAGIPDESISESGFREKPYALPSGYLLDTLIERGGTRYAIQNIATSASSFGTVAAFSFDTSSRSFIKSDSVQLLTLPRSIGRISPSPSPQLLLQGSGGTTYIFQGNSAHPVFGDMVFADTTSSLPFFATSLQDIDGDGIDELIGRQEVQVGSGYQDRYEADKIVNGQRVAFGNVSDTTTPAPHYASNTFSTPDTKAIAIAGNAPNGIAFLDDDADLIINKYDPSPASKFITTFVDENAGYTEGRNFAIGDFNGDGLPDIALAYHRSYDYNDDLEIEPSYWTVKVLLNTGTGSFLTVYTDHFYNARSNSPYRSSLGTIKSVDGNAGDDLVLSLFPNFYLLRYNSSTGTINPVWHFPLANSPRGALSYDFDNNGIREFGFDTGDSVRFFEWDASTVSRTPSPAGLEVIPRDTGRIDLRWSEVSSVDRYDVLRALDEPNATFETIGSTQRGSFSDTTVTNDTHYLYSVKAHDPSYTTPLSFPCPSVTGYAHHRPTIIRIISRSNALELQTSNLLATTGLSGGEFVCDDTLSFSSAIVAGDSTVVLTPMREPFSSGTHTLRVRSFGLRDVWNSPFDTTARITWEEHPIVATAAFYIKQWSFQSGNRIRVLFSMRPDDNALLTSNYTLSPFGEIGSVTRDPANDTAVILTLTPSTQLSPIGNSYTVCAHDITSGDQQLAEDGRCAGETPVGSSLSHLFVYPSPVHESDEVMTFAGLTPQASIIIYTTGMRLLRRLESTDQSGGIQWDLRDETGRKLSSGVYIYRVSGKDSAGNEVEVGQSKFVIVTDR